MLIVSFISSSFRLRLLVICNRLPLKGMACARKVGIVVRLSFSTTYNTDISPLKIRPEPYQRNFCIAVLSGCANCGSLSSARKRLALLLSQTGGY